MNRIRNYYRTDFLYPKLNMLTGMGSIFNLAGKYFNFNYSDCPDKKAIESDWGVIGIDITKAIQENPVNTLVSTSLNVRN